MARKCTICEHKKRDQIDSALVLEGASLRDIAGQYRVSKSALKRHMDNGHISEKCLTIKQIQNVHEIDSFQEKHQKISEDLWKQKESARTNKRPELELKITREIIRLHDIDGKASGVYREKVEHSGKIELPLSNMSDEEVKALARKVLTESD